MINCWFPLHFLSSLSSVSFRIIQKLLWHVSFNSWRNILIGSLITYITYKTSTQNFINSHKTHSSHLWVHFHVSTWKSHTRGPNIRRMSIVVAMICLSAVAVLNFGSLILNWSERGASFGGYKVVKISAGKNIVCGCWLIKRMSGCADSTGLAGHAGWALMPNINNSALNNCNISHNNNSYNNNNNTRYNNINDMRMP